MEGESSLALTQDSQERRGLDRGLGPELTVLLCRWGSGILPGALLVASSVASFLLKCKNEQPVLGLNLCPCPVPRRREEGRG